MLRIKICAILIILFLPYSQVIASPEIDVQLPPSPVRVAESTEIRVQFTWKKDDASYRFAIPALKTNNLEVLNRGESTVTEVRESGEWIKKTFVYSVKPLQSGMAFIEEHQINYFDAANQLSGSVSFPKQSLKIESVSERNKNTSIIPILSIFFGTLLIAAIAWRLRKKSGLNQEKMISSSNETTPYDQLIKSSFHKQTEIENKDFYLEWEKLLSETIKSRFHITLPELPDERHRKLLIENGLDRKGVDELLEFADKIQSLKYAGLQLSHEDFTKLNRHILDWFEKYQASLV